jgi:hypothetical protein
VTEGGCDSVVPCLRKLWKSSFNVNLAVDSQFGNSYFAHFLCNVVRTTDYGELDPESRALAKNLRFKKFLSSAQTNILVTVR